MPRPVYQGPELNELRERFSWETREKVAVPACPTCGHNGFHVYALEDRYALPTRAQMCSQCGLVYLDPILSAKEYKEFYTGWYHDFVRAYRREPCGPKHYIRKGFILGRQIGDYLKCVKLPEKVNILDIGGSTGIVCRELRKKLAERGCVANCTILDPSRHELETAKKYGHKTICGLFEETKLRGSYDVVIFARTIDHVLDPVGCLKRIRGLLKPSGVAYIDFVDVLQQAKLFGIPGCFHIDHVTNWNPTTAAWVLRKVGFEQIDLAIDYDSCWRFILKRGKPQDGMPDRESIEFIRRELDGLRKIP